MTRSLDRVREEAATLLVFIDGAEDSDGSYAGPELRRRARIAARALLEALDDLEAERSVRVAVRARCEQLQRIVGQSAYRDLTERLRREEAR
jgi:hypothetical protein